MSFIFPHPSFIHIGISHAAGASYIFLLYVLSCFPHFPCPKNMFLCCWENGQHIFTILGFIAVIFAHAMHISVVEFKLLTQGLISPFYQSVFGWKYFFLKPRTRILLWVHPVFWSELAWSGRGKNYLDKPSVERNFIDSSIGAGFPSLHTLKSIVMEGIA